MKKLMSLVLAISLVGLVAFGITKAMDIDSAYGYGIVSIVDGGVEPRDVQISMVPDMSHPSWSKEFDFGATFITNNPPYSEKIFYVRNNMPTPYCGEENCGWAIPSYNMYATNIDNAELAEDIYLVVGVTYQGEKRTVYEGSLAGFNGLTETNYIPVNYLWETPTEVEMIFSIEGANVTPGEEVNYRMVLEEVV